MVNEQIVNTLVFPVRVLEVAVSPIRINLYVRLFLLVQYPVVDKLACQFLFEHGFYSLEVVGKVSTVNIGLVLEFDDGANFFVLCGVYHYKRLG